MLRPEMRAVGYLEAVGCDIRLRSSCLGLRSGFGRRRPEQLHRHAVFVRYAAPSNLSPQVLAGAGSDDREELAGKLRNRKKLVLGRSEFVERPLRLDRQQLIDNAVHRVE